MIRHPTYRTTRKANRQKQILGNVAKTEMEVVGDIVEGRSVKEVLKDCGLSSIKRKVGVIMQQSQLNNINNVPAEKQRKKKLDTYSTSSDNGVHE